MNFGSVKSQYLKNNPLSGFLIHNIKWNIYCAQGTDGFEEEKRSTSHQNYDQNLFSIYKLLNNFSFYIYINLLKSLYRFAGFTQLERFVTNAG